MANSKKAARSIVGKLLDNNMHLFSEAMTDVLRLGFDVEGSPALDEEAAREFYEELTCGHAQEIPVGNVNDVIEIWHNSLLQDDNYDNISLSPWAAFRKGDVHAGVKLMKNQATRLGIDYKLESYIEGVPLEDIIVQ